MSAPAALHAVSAVRAAAEQLAGVAWDELDPTDLPAVADSLATVKALAEGALVAVAGQLDATDAASAHGWASAKDFLTHLLGGHKGAGGSLVRAAAQVRDLPEVSRALSAGDISVAQARVIGQRAGSLPHDPALREKAAGLMLDRVRDHGYDATDLDRAFADVVRELDPDGSLLAQDRDKKRAERGAHLARFLSFARDAFGGVRVKGYATLEEAEIVKAALMPLAAPVTSEPGACGGDPDHSWAPLPEQRKRAKCPEPLCRHDGTDPREHGVRMWDALVEACTRLQATDHLPHAHGTTARIHVTVGYDDLVTKLEREGVLSSGERLSATAVRRLACDAEIIPGVLGSSGEILDVGRAQRLVTTAIWLALVLRDQHCSFPGCTRPPIACDAHHITHWADGGTTSLDNLVLLCRRHHRITHHTPWTVAIDPDTRRPVWIPPPRVDDRDRFTYYPPWRPPPLVA